MEQGNQLNQHKWRLEEYMQEHIVKLKNIYNCLLIMQDALANESVDNKEQVGSALTIVSEYMKTILKELMAIRESGEGKESEKK